MLAAETFGIALGLLMALGVFALKNAVGNYYFLALPGKRGRKAVILILMQTVYVLLFLAAFALLKRVDFFRAADSAAFLRNGALIHLLLCAGMVYWGIRLLLQREAETPDWLDSHGWLLLAVPCPVCASAVFLVCSFALMLFPDFALCLRWGIPLLFVVMNLFFLMVLLLLGRFFRLRPLELTGRMMILIAFYFILILLIAPQFQEAGKLYAAARSSGPDVFPQGGRLLVCLLVCIMAGGGFLWNLLHERRS